MHPLPICIRYLASYFIGKNIFPFGSTIFGSIGPGAIADIVCTHQQHSGVGPLFKQLWQRTHEGVVTAVGL